MHELVHSCLLNNVVHYLLCFTLHYHTLLLAVDNIPYWISEDLLQWYQMFGSRSLSRRVRSACRYPGPEISLALLELPVSEVLVLLRFSILGIWSF